MKALATLAILVGMTVGACAAQQRQQPSQTSSDQPSKPAARDEAPTAPGSGTFNARRVVQVSLREDDDAARAAIADMTGTEIAAEVLADYEISGNAGKIVTTRVEPKDEGDAINVIFWVDLRNAGPQAPQVAREVADDLVKRLRQRIMQNAQGALAEQTARLAEERNRTAAELQQAREQLNQLRAKMREATGRADASSERIRDELNQLEDARQEIQLELESRAARMKALTDNIAQVSARVEEKVKNDPVATELQKVVEVREKQAELVKSQVERGQSSRAEYEEALAQAAEARARLLDRRSETAESAGGDAVRSWNREIMSLSVDTAELQAKLDRLSQRLANYQKVMDDLDQLDALHEQVETAQDSLRQIDAHLREMQRQLARVRPPRSIVLESDENVTTGTPDEKQ